MIYSRKEYYMPNHCDCCGKENPKTNDGYTICCNEPVCDGRDKNKYGLPDNFVVACCWAKAEILFKRQGKKVPNGSYMLD
jgi:hypothetical protein